MQLKDAKRAVTPFNGTAVVRIASHGCNHRNRGEHYPRLGDGLVGSTSSEKLADDSAILSN